MVTSTNAWRTMALKVLACIVAALILAACDRGTAPGSCAALGLCDPPTPPAVLADVVCDASRGSTCTRRNLERTVDTVLGHVMTRPGSRVRVWAQGARGEETAVVSEVLVGEVRGGDRARRARIARDIAAARETLLSGAERIFAATPARRSPIAESLARVVLADAGDTRRHIVVITDGKEVSELGDFECRALPTDEAFLSSLKRNDLLPPARLAGVAVSFAFASASSEPGSGCPSTVARENRVRALWSAALKEAGAEPIEVTSGAPTLPRDGEELEQSP